VVALGLLALPPMLRAGYDQRFACGLTAAVGTLGTVLPPSIILILLSDQMRIARSEAQRLLGQASGAPFLMRSLFLGMVVPVVLVILGYLLIIVWRALRSPEMCPPHPAAVSVRRALLNIVPPLAIVAGTLYTIVSGMLYTVEAAGAAAIAITRWALVRHELSPATLAEITRLVTRVSGAMFLLIIGANSFSLVFRGFGGDSVTRQLITSNFGSPDIAIPVVFAILLVFGFFLDALEIIFLVVPIAIPPLIVLGGDPMWLAVLVGITLQTSFLLPPSGFALFFLRNVAPREISMGTIYRGVRPFVLVQIALLIAVLLWPVLATWLPGRA
jgi:tripartite ATP-independent transporter DctM subunit